MSRSFWNSQPVNRGNSSGAIDSQSPVQKNPIELPSKFSWMEIEDIHTILTFLEEYYVEDITSMYRLSYSKSFFEFLFNHPEHRKEYSLGLFKDQQLIGYILARNHILNVRAIDYPAVSINFLCINREFRNKNFAPLLIKEITRRVNLNGIFQAIFTAEKDYGFSISRARYFHFPMNSKNLIQACMIDSEDEVKEIPKMREGTRILNNSDEIYDLYHEKAKKFILHENIPVKIFNQIFCNNENVITVFNKEKQEFASFFIIKTKCLKYGIILKRAYLYYWSGCKDIVNDAISYSEQLDVDMFDILNLADNSSLVDELDLQEGSGVLYYHLFNLNEKILESSDLNFILF